MAWLPTGHAGVSSKADKVDGALKEWSIVMLKPKLTDQQYEAHYLWLNKTLQTNPAAKGGRLHCVFETGYAGHFTQEIATLIQTQPEVSLVEEDRLLKVTAPGPLDWGLDRLDQQAGFSHDFHRYEPFRAGVDVYILDSGLLTNHSEFTPQGRAKVGISFSGDAGADPVGHGTHVAGTVGGTNVGVAPNATLIAVKVIDNDGSGPASNVIMGLEWVVRSAKRSGRPSVVNMSIGGPRSAALDMAVLGAIRNGITIVAAAGNDGADACNDSPANLARVITVAASTSADSRASFSNFGTCVTMFAPGLRIRSAWSSAADAFNILDGTSMASPHIAGAAAIALSQNPRLTPAEVQTAIFNAGVDGRLTGLRPGDPNRLLNLEAFFNSGDKTGFTGATSLPGASVAAPAPASPVRTSGTTNPTNAQTATAQPASRIPSSAGPQLSDPRFCLPLAGVATFAFWTLF
ncbi:peptidase S8 and S53 subtilisin kexin sedolisin [Powellomyces hirtus]|nr:peptidase S8 and S53 subtilisin kexin sedolisin [Powellomyces hirtus]